MFDSDFAKYVKHMFEIVIVNGSLKCMVDSCDLKQEFNIFIKVTFLTNGYFDTFFQSKILYCLQPDNETSNKM